MSLLIFLVVGCFLNAVLANGNSVDNQTSKIAKMSMFMVNQPVAKNDIATGVITFADITGSTFTAIDIGLISTDQRTQIKRSFLPCASFWVSGVSSINIDACYRYFYSAYMTFEQARFFCASNGGTIAFANSGVELDFLKSVMTVAGGPTGDGAWLSYNQERDNSNFWVDEEEKSSLTVPFWQEVSDQYPLRKTGGRCAYYDYASRRAQNDACTARRPVMCKRETAIASMCGPNPEWVYDAASSRCFRVIASLSTYSTAVSTCRQMGGRLAVPESNSSLSFIQNLAAIANPQIDYYMALWRPSGRSFKFYDGWQDFAPAFPLNWLDGQPTFDPEENCAALNVASGQWIAVHCADMDGFICEKPIYGRKPRRYFARSTPHFATVAPLESKSGYNIWGGSCPNDYVEFNAQCYRFVEAEGSSQADAKSKCQAEGGDLPSFSSEEGLPFIRGLLPSHINKVWLDEIAEINCLSRGANSLLITAVCSQTNGYVCMQPAAVCPPDWKIWGGSCYRVFPTKLRVLPGTDFDTSRVPCQIEDSLPVSPINANEHAMITEMVRNTSGDNALFIFGYRRLATSSGFIDLSGRGVYFADNRTKREPVSGNFYAYGTSSSNDSIQFASDLWTDATVCHTSSKLSADICLSECLATSDLDCRLVYYNGMTCQFMTTYNSVDAHSTGELYTLRKDICSDVLLQEAVTITSEEGIADVSDVASSGFAATSDNDTLAIKFSNHMWLSAIALGKLSRSEYVKTFKVSTTFDGSSWKTLQYPAGFDFIFESNYGIDEDFASVKLPEPTLLEAMKIVPLTFVGKPSYRLRLVGCNAAIFTDYADYKFSNPGTYIMSATAYGSAEDNVTVAPVIVEVGSYRLTASPPYGMLAFIEWNEQEQKDLHHASVVYALWYYRMNNNFEPSIVVMDFGDNTTAENRSVSCDTQNNDTIIDGPWILCAQFRHIYSSANIFHASATIADKFSSQSISAIFTACSPIQNLELEVKFAENESNPVWMDGYPRIEPTIGAKSYSLSFFPIYQPLRIAAKTNDAENLRYCFSSSIEGNLTNCDTANPPNFLIKTFNYDTACLPSLVSCGLTLSVVASNAIDTATASITIFIQKPSLGLEVYRNRTSSTTKNSTSLWLTYDQLGTDVCIEVDYGEKKQLFGAEYMCAENHDQEEMQTLTSELQVSAKAIDISQKSFSNPDAEVKKVTVENFVDKQVIPVVTDF